MRKGPDGASRRGLVFSEDDSFVMLGVCPRNTVKITLMNKLDLIAFSLLLPIPAWAARPFVTDDARLTPDRLF